MRLATVTNTNGRTASVTPASSEAKRRTKKDFTWNEAMVKVFVKNGLFPRMKWVIEEKGHMDFDLKDNKKPCKGCLLYCGMMNKKYSTTDRRRFWNMSKNLVREEIDSRRNRVQGILKIEYNGEQQSGV